MGRVAAAETPSLYLETMEAPESENTKPNEVGHTEVLCPQMGYIKVCWNVAGSPVLTRSIRNERLAQAGYYSILARHASLHLCD